MKDWIFMGFLAWFWCLLCFTVIIHALKGKGSDTATCITIFLGLLVLLAVKGHREERSKKK